MYSFLSGSFGFTLCLQDSSVLLNVVVVYSFCCLTLFYEYFTVYPFVVDGHLHYYFFLPIDLHSILYSSSVFYC